MAVQIKRIFSEICGQAYLLKTYFCTALPSYSNRVLGILARFSHWNSGLDKSVHSEEHVLFHNFGIRVFTANVMKLFKSFCFLKMCVFLYPVSSYFSALN